MVYSIIIPTLNEEKLLPIILNELKENNILESFDAELIISDGGSSDNTIQIARQFTNNIIVKSSERKQNIAAGRNEGSLLAKGSILIFLGADIYIPDITNFFNFISENFVHSNYFAMTCKVKISPDEEILSDRIFHFLSNTYFFLLNVFGLGMGRGECQIVRRSIFNELNGYNEELAAGEDFDLFRRIRRKGKILFGRKLYVYESPRRYRKYGYFSVYKSWLLNAYYVLFKKKSMDKEWEQIR